MACLCDPVLCTGCSACAGICPSKCITMEVDREGFRRPVVDETRCIGCGLCNKVCPVLHVPASSGMPEAYAAKNNDETVRAVSTSGGVFTLLAEQVLY